MISGNEGFKISIFMRFSRFAALLAVFGAGFSAASAEEAEVVDPSAPLIVHTPVLTAVRGVPVDISAVITSQGGVITSQTVHVKVSDVGTPVEYPLTGTGSGEAAYHAAIPVSLVKGVSVFWYSINANDSKGQIRSTKWIRCVIIDPIEQGGGGTEVKAVVAGGGGGEAGGTGSTAAYVVGGVLLAGGTALIIENNQGGGGKKKSVPEPEPEPVPKKPGGGSNESAPMVPVLPPPCITTGDESVTYENFSYYCDKSVFDIMVLVCGTCTDATIMATTTWGESAMISGYNNETCSPTGQKLALPLPESQQFINPGDETITVYANGVQIDQVVWPPLSDNDCL